MAADNDDANARRLILFAFAGAYQAICRRTKAKFGTAINPHLFRLSDGEMGA